MSERTAEEITDELYTVQPDAFAAARDAAVKTARAAGQADTARELATLRRPTKSAWLLNLLWRRERELMEGLLELGGALRGAQESASGAELQRLMAQRRQVEAALIRRARTLAREAGVATSDAIEREAQETLAAALAQPEVADEVRSGRLVKPAAYAGFGVLPASSARPRPAQSSADVAEPPTTTQHTDTLASTAKTADLAAYRAQKERERAREERARREQVERRARAAEDAVTQAQRAFESAGHELAERHAVAERATAEYERLRRELDEVRARMHRLQLQATQAEERASTRLRERGEAERAHATAQLALHRAERDRDSLPEA